MDRMPKPGEFYRHFKNKLYQILAVARHTETGEELVVYQALYGDFRIFARPLPMFLEPVDREKYPDADQYYRFEQVAFVTDPQEENCKGYGMDPAGNPARQEMNPWLERFLDAEGYSQQLQVLSQMLGKVGQQELDSIYLALDISMPAKAGDVDAQLRGIMKHLETRRRYDGSRLR